MPMLMANVDKIIALIALQENHTQKIPLNSTNYIIYKASKYSKVVYVNPNVYVYLNNFCKIFHM